MEQQRPESEFLARQAFSPDLAPMYQLTEQDYQAVVNHLSNLTVAIIEHLQSEGQWVLAQQIAGHANGILVTYDEDMAEHVRWVARGAEDDPGRRAEGVVPSTQKRSNTRLKRLSTGSGS